MTSQPMRSQNFNLSTNQMSRFQPDSRCLPNWTAGTPPKTSKARYDQSCLESAWGGHSQTVSTSQGERLRDYQKKRFDLIS